MVEGFSGIGKKNRETKLSYYHTLEEKYDICRPNSTLFSIPFFSLYGFLFFERKKNQSHHLYSIGEITFNPFKPFSYDLLNLKVSQFTIKLPANYNLSN